MRYLTACAFQPMVLYAARPLVRDALSDGLRFSADGSARGPSASPGYAGAVSSVSGSRKIASAPLPPIKRIHLNITLISLLLDTNGNASFKKEPSWLCLPYIFILI